MKIDAMFDLGSQENLIAIDLVKKLGLEVRDNPHPSRLGWVHKDAELKVRKQCKIKFSLNADFNDEVDMDVVPLDVCGVMFGSPYMYMHYALFMRRANQYRLIKDGKLFIINAHKGKSKISLVSANQAKKLISSNKKYVLLFLRENQFVEESIRGKTSLEGCTKKQKQKLEELLQAYKDVFRDHKGLPLKREVEIEIQLLPDSPLPNIGLYR